MRMNENGIFFIFGTTKLKYIKNDSTWLILQYYGIQLFTIHKLSVVNCLLAALNCCWLFFSFFNLLLCTQIQDLKKTKTF